MEATPVKIQDIQANYQHILKLVGSQSYVNWDNFTKTSTDLNKQIEELLRALSLFRQIQQKRFLTTMKKLKATDIPDLLKTVKAKKLPRQALKAVTSNFQFDNEGKIKLVSEVNALKGDSQVTFQAYVSVNEMLTKQLKQSLDLVVQKIKQSGLYEQPPHPKELIPTFKPNFSQQILNALKKQIKIQYMAGTDHISIQTYGQIVHNTFPLVKDEYKRLTYESREKQRGLIKDSQKYVEAIIEYLTNTESVILEGQRALAKAAGLSQKKVEDSQMALMEKGLAQTVLLIQSGLRTSVKESLPPKNEANFETTKKIIKHQVNLVKQKTPMFKEMFSGIEKSPQNFQIMPLIVALTLNDFVYFNFKLQEEDFMKAVTDQIVLNNPEVSALFKEMETAIIKLMKDTGIINEDMAKVIEMQSQQIQGTFGDLNQNMGQGPLGGGVLPGSNPLDLLQNQQKQQFEQMQKGKK